MLSNDDDDRPKLQMMEENDKPKITIRDVEEEQRLAREGTVSPSNIICVFVDVLFG